MADSAQEGLIIGTADGTYYAIPRSVLEQHRCTQEQVEALKKAPVANAADVSGYSAPQGFDGSFGGGILFQQGGNLLIATSALDQSNPFVQFSGVLFQ
ncbi:MAG TPA: hypothetical protein VKV26_24635 [Dehalococcoidia bacterium]|nr:hypothetical protein [Dehalococcoidia bacterium]